MPKNLKPIDQQIVAITGASSGIGLATALLAAKRGATVALIARSENTLQKIAAHIAVDGGHALAIKADVGNRTEVSNAVHAILQAHGRIDTWVNNAGVSIYGRLDEVDDPDSRRLFETNFWGVVNGSLAALPFLRRQGGALINVGSEASDAAIPLQGMYSASKHAVKGFTDALRIELDADDAGVAVTLIQPTAVDTPFPEHAGSYLSLEPKLPTPMIDPTKVAEAILDAAVRPTRHARVGAMAVVNTTVARLAPHLADSLAKLQIGRQQRQEAPHDLRGTLYEPSESGRVHGRGNDRAADFAVARESNIRPD
jgi:short-subunit dehydrogenase